MIEFSDWSTDGRSHRPVLRAVGLQWQRSSPQRPWRTPAPVRLALQRQRRTLKRQWLALERPWWILQWPSVPPKRERLPSRRGLWTLKREQCISRNERRILRRDRLISGNEGRFLVSESQDSRQETSRKGYNWLALRRILKSSRLRKPDFRKSPCGSVPTGRPHVSPGHRPGARKPARVHSPNGAALTSTGVKYPIDEAEQRKGPPRWGFLLVVVIVPQAEGQSVPPKPRVVETFREPTLGLHRVDEVVEHFVLFLQNLPTEPLVVDVCFRFRAAGFFLAPTSVAGSGTPSVRRGGSVGRPATTARLQMIFFFAAAAKLVSIRGIPLEQFDGAASD